MNIGKRMRELRHEKALTLYDLARQSGVALATLSRMENDKMTGTIDSHNRICKVLGVSISDLYKALEDSYKTIENVKKANRTEHFVHAKGAKYELLVSKTLDKKLMPLMIRIKPNGSTQKEQNRFGIEKFLYMLSGAIDVTVGTDSYILKQGDSLYFDASLPHILRNKAKSEALAICVVSPPAL